ncbi:FAD:protein FMN transferase [Alteromonas facilis]|uniref:FAD:protein FMN transferase n=1 Tax=Alteromonas facilis TaxID=2048004 RepID=UPI0013DC6998|nr:FAD:protein FMN transferase [Alteromonas facilis]
MTPFRLPILFLFTLCFAVACSQPVPEETHFTGKTMGTTYNIKVPPNASVDENILHDQIKAALANVNALMSTYDPQSELSRFNQSRSQEPFAISPQTHLVIAEAIRLAGVTEGALDITIGPVVNLWGFGPDMRPEVIPTDETITEALSKTGIAQLQLTDRAVIKYHPELYVDLSTIAKGYGVDVIAELLQANGFTDYLVEIGGEMRVAGKKLNGQLWRIAIEKPVTEQRILQKVIEIGDNAIATSGDYRNYYEQDGVRYSHLIDPTTGKPIQHNLVSVTVVHPSTMTADGLATALAVMGAEKAKALAELNDWAVMLITKEGDEFVEWASSGFEQRVTVVEPTH